MVLFPQYPLSGKNKTNNRNYFLPQLWANHFRVIVEETSGLHASLTFVVCFVRVLFWIFLYYSKFYCHSPRAYQFVVLICWCFLSAPATSCFVSQQQQPATSSWTAATALTTKNQQHAFPVWFNRMSVISTFQILCYSYICTCCVCLLVGLSFIILPCGWYKCSLVTFECQYNQFAIYKEMTLCTIYILERHFVCKTTSLKHNSFCT